MNFAPAVERPWRDAWPLVARTDDGNAWVTGACWLYCRREGVRVLWIGSVHTPGATGDLYACGSCVAELDHMVRTQSHARDAPAGTQTRQKARARNKNEACEHRQTENRDGKTHCRVCEQQLYL
ncbi:hypothetical protein [Streptomyces sp. NBC_01217]|uniref:hypothetical protein n=1 Tax=Streptomyces sp. NBC_01217 TaxID=2903779 RepID=UPI002E1529AA|nr:hypothetical protein OG507_28305 [Streptomyces sp. NBC_01217]